MATRRYLKDAKLRKSSALPAAGANNATGAIDLGSEPHPTLETIFARVSVPATPALVSAATITLSLEDSADGSSFAAVGGVGTHVVTGPAEGGGAASEFDFALPPTVRRYLRARAAVSAAGGNSTAVSYQLDLVF